ncbi:M28 family peptidase [Terriglobus roseus]|uniref:Carboxypeptidase Q n=1 Tax=Terriglobus roseus TaxID=392734 RepID=A0A1H4N2I4_9BACT|nr:M28 family peptidase [Terriglobus roseus]SEB89433.1 Peptidase family M28 [Terriglobus roseus]
MKANWIVLAGTLVLASACSVLMGQEKEDRTLLSQQQMTAIINEVSGERAMHHVQELVPYQFVRPTSEYQSHFREAEAMARMAKEYGFSNVAIEDYPTGQTWQPTVGELWTSSPKNSKIYDIHDIPESLASTNANGDISGDLVSVGQGAAADFAGKDVKGKFVLSLAPSGLAAIYGRAAAAGAIGVVGISAIGAGDRAVDYPNAVVWTTVVAQPNTAAWAVSPKVARELETMLNRGQKVTMRSITKSEQVPNKQEIVHAEIPGDGSTTQEVAIGGHLFESYIKQGANDDSSGCALTLEIGRAYLKLIAEGKLPRPKRTINFQWVQEISGTNAWFNAHPDKQKVIIGDLNFDMEALRLSQSRSFWILQRTPDTFPSYINDIAQSPMEYIAEVSRERVRYRATGYGASQPVESPNGSTDAFYIKVDKHYGSSDHVTYMQHGIPAVMFITWPDMWYHSSQDTPDKQDPTQYKRAAAVGTASLMALASGTDEMAARILSENIGRGLARMGESHTKGLGYMADATDAASLTDGYKEARIAVLHQAEVEKGVVTSASVLWTNADSGKQKTSAFLPLIDQRATELLSEVKAAYQLQALQRGVPAAEPVMTAQEKEAANLMVEGVARPGGLGGPGGGGGGGQRGAAPTGPQLPQEMNAEFAILLGKHKTALEIRDFLSGEFTPLPLADLMAVLHARETAGTVKLTVKAETPAKTGKAGKRASK